MSEFSKLPYGRIMENEGLVTYQISREETNIQDVEQLEELKRDESLFFSCQHYQVKEDLVTIFYKKKAGYVCLAQIKTMDDKKKKKVTDKLLQTESLVGTQFSTFLHPANIYVNERGDVNFAHRSIRSVLPPEEFTEQGLLNELKPILIALHSNYTFEEIVEDKQLLASGNNSLLNAINAATSIDQLRKLFATHVPAGFSEDKKTHNVSHKPTEVKQPKKIKLSLMSGVLIGVLIGMIGLYLIKVVPLADSASALESEMSEQENSLTEENQELQEKVDQNQLIIKGYQEAMAGNTEAAITNLEKVNSPDKNAEQTLIQQYIKLNTVDSLAKAAGMGEAYQAEIVEKLAQLESDEANDVILSLTSSAPEVLIEQAWLEKDYKTVLEVYKQISDNDHAKLLAANSYLELENNKEAMKLGKELKNKQVQIGSLEIEKKKTKDNKDMDKEEKEEKLDELNKKIKELKD